LLSKPPAAPVNETFAALGLLDWKPIVGALLLPPVPLLVLILLAWLQRGRRPVLAQLMLLLSMVGLWLSLCQVTGVWLERQLTVAAELSPARLIDWRRTLAGHKPVVVVLGGGVQGLAPEYGEAHLGSLSLQRLHYGLWLGKQLQSPVMVSGGAGPAQASGPFEADVANRIASRDYGRTLRWLEPGSRDTRENARRSLQVLREEGITEVFLVTHAWHMQRALRAFEQEAARVGFSAKLVPAPMGLATENESAALRWMPSPDGYRRVHSALREMVGLLAGA
jgi:uncharacterized SAM-binding protein YcdF (DUF218 family)